MTFLKTLIATPIILWVLLAIPGWITNAIWTFTKAEGLTEVLLGIVGMFLAPVGAVHGIYLWF